jgi:hypothetical protein
MTTSSLVSSSAGGLVIGGTTQGTSVLMDALNHLHKLEYVRCLACKNIADYSEWSHELSLACRSKVVAGRLWGILVLCQIDHLHFASVDCSVDVLPEISSADPSVADFKLDFKYCRRLGVSSPRSFILLRHQDPSPV